MKDKIHKRFIKVTPKEFEKLLNGLIWPTVGPLDLNRHHISPTLLPEPVRKQDFQKYLFLSVFEFSTLMKRKPE